MKVTLKVPAQAKQVDNTYQVAQSLGLRVYGESLEPGPVAVELPPSSVMLVVMRWQPRGDGGISRGRRRRQCI